MACVLRASRRNRSRTFVSVASDRVHHLDGARPVDELVPRPVHRGHAPLAEHVLDDVAARDRLADERVVDGRELGAVQEAVDGVGRVPDMALRAGLHWLGKTRPPVASILAAHPIAAVCARASGAHEFDRPGARVRASARHGEAFRKARGQRIGAKALASAASVGLAALCASPSRLARAMRIRRRARPPDAQRPPRRARRPERLRPARRGRSRRRPRGAWTRGAPRDRRRAHGRRCVDGRREPRASGTARGRARALPARHARAGQRVAVEPAARRCPATTRRRSRRRAYRRRGRCAPPPEEHAQDLAWLAAPRDAGSARALGRARRALPRVLQRRPSRARDVREPLSPLRALARHDAPSAPAEVASGRPRLGLDDRERLRSPPRTPPRAPPDSGSSCRETARIYGLTFDRWLDQRMSATLATDAAADLLGDLHRRFGGWELALAGFNMGYAGLASVLRRFNTNDFWSLSRTEGALPWETTLYVPKVFAAAVVAHNLGGVRLRRPRGRSARRDRRGRPSRRGRRSPSSRRPRAARPRTSRRSTPSSARRARRLPPTPTGSACTGERPAGKGRRRGAGAGAAAKRPAAARPLRRPLRRDARADRGGAQDDHAEARRAQRDRAGRGRARRHRPARARTSTPRRGEAPAATGPEAGGRGPLGRVRLPGSQARLLPGARRRHAQGDRQRAARRRPTSSRAGTGSTRRRVSRRG